MNCNPQNVLKYSREIANEAKFIKINNSAVDKLAADLAKILKNPTDEALGVKTTGEIEDDIQQVFLIDSINFCFWAEKDKPKWLVEYPTGKKASGGWYSLTKVFERALDEKIPILDVDYLLNLNEKEARHLFRGGNNIEVPLFKERLKCLKDSAKVLKGKYSSEFINVLKRAENDAVKLIEIVCKDFKYFRDPFLKRAQILPKDLSYLKGIKIKNLDELTAFADYRLPQVLRHYNVLIYDTKLARKIDNYVLIKAGSGEETEIRAATVWACELLKKKLNTNAGNIDNGLWLLSQDLKTTMLPHHRTYTIFY